MTIPRRRDAEDRFQELVADGDPKIQQLRRARRTLGYRGWASAGSCWCELMTLDMMDSRAVFNVDVDGILCRRSIVAPTRGLKQDYEIHVLRACQRY